MVNMTLMCLAIIWQFYELEQEHYNLRNTELMFETIYARTDTSILFSLELYVHGISYLYLLKRVIQFLSSNKS